jgi:hypothetical protein
MEFKEIESSHYLNFKAERDAKTGAEIETNNGVISELWVTELPDATKRYEVPQALWDPGLLRWLADVIDAAPEVAARALPKAP